LFLYEAHKWSTQNDKNIQNITNCGGIFFLKRGNIFWDMYRGNDCFALNLAHSFSHSNDLRNQRGGKKKKEEEGITNYFKK